MSDKAAVSDAEASSVLNVYWADTSSGIQGIRRALEQFLASRAAQPALQAEPVRVRLLTTSQVQAAYAALRRGDLTLLPAQMALLAKITEDNPHIKFEIEGEAG